VQEPPPAADPPPWKESQNPAPPATRQPEVNPFYQDPLVEAALEKFAGKRL
jgi:hypothetical protein